MKTLCRSHRWEFLLGLMMIVSGAKAAVAVDWDGGGPSGEWLDALNWEFDIVPTTGDLALITNDTAMITGVSVPPIQTLQLGAGSIPGGLTMLGGGASAMLEATSSVAIERQGDLQVGPGNAQLLTAAVSNQGDVTIGLDGQITAFQQYVQNGGGSTTTLVDGQIVAPSLQIIDGELGGRGQITGNVTVGGPGMLTAPTIAPGVGIGTLEVDGNLQFNSSANLLVEIDTSGPSVRADQLMITGTASLAGTLDLNLTGSGNIPLSAPVEILVADTIQPRTFFDQINVFSTGAEAVVVTFIPTGDLTIDAGVNIHTS